MSKFKNWLTFLLIFALSVSVFPMPVQAGRIQYCLNMKVVVDGEEICSIPALDADYENQMYISLKGLSYALKGTQKAFEAEVTKQEISITTGGSGAAEVYMWDDDTKRVGENVSVTKHKLLLNENEKKYYSVILSQGNSYDAFMPPVSLAMMFDMDMKVTEDTIRIGTAKPFSISAGELERSGYLQGVNALAAGDGTTGEIFYEYDAETAFPIASTTKLMTYFVFMDAVAEGQCSLEDTAVISEQAAVLSNGPDGVISMKAGKRVPIKELLRGMLLPSSNECALAIAEHTAGSEKAFVALMNAKAAELGLENTVFYNCHGLPFYEDQLLPAKEQNHMTAEEMFILASAIVNTYPQITEITSEKEYHMAAFDKDLKNTNALLYNIDQVTGLKTGTTNKAGACLVTCTEALKDGETHKLITVLFGADGDANRGTASELMVRYAMEALKNGSGDYRKIPAADEEETGIPQDPEKVIKKLLAGMAEISFG